MQDTVLSAKVDVNTNVVAFNNPYIVTPKIDMRVATVLTPAQDLQNQQAERGLLLARRRFQRGTLDLQGKRSPKWVAQWREDELRPGMVKPYRVHRKRIIGTRSEFPTRRLAQRELERVLAEVNNPQYRPAVSITFAEFAEQWKTKVLPQMKPSTQSTTRSQLKNQLAYFDGLNLRDIQPAVVQTFVTACTGSPKTIRNAVMTLRSMWSTAKAWGYVTHDPFDGLRLPLLEKQEQPYFTAKQMRRIIRRAEEPYQTLYWLAAETGLRAGELAGLQWRDVKNGHIEVRRSIWGSKAQSPKTTNGVRTFAISGELQTRLESKRRPEGYIFATRNNTSWNMNDVQKRNLVPLLKKLAMKKAGFHSFRHGNETVMDGLQTPVALRLNRLGHGDTRMMMTYSHVIGADDRQLASEFGRMFAPTSPAVL
jgi:integrase